MPSPLTLSALILGVPGALVLINAACAADRQATLRVGAEHAHAAGGRAVIRIDLPWTSPPISPNGPRMHPHAHAGRVRGVLESARYAIRNAHLEPMAGANVELNWRIPDKRRRDPDNLSATLKPVLDALVKEGVLPDDSWVHVPSATCRILPPNGEPAAMWLTLSDPDEEIR